MNVQTRRGVRVIGAVLAVAIAVSTVAMAGGALKTKKNTIEVSVGSAAGAGVHCGRDGEFVSGGFSMPVVPGPTGPKLFPYFAPGLVAAANFGDQPGTLTSIGYCSKDGPKLRRKKKTTTVPPGDTGSVKAKCRRGKQALIGGFESPEPLPAAAPPEFGIYPFVSKLAGKRAWKVSGFADIQGADPEEQFLRALVFCHKGGPALDVESKQTTIADGDVGSVKAKCKAGEQALSGGFASSADGSGANTSYARAFVSKRAGKRSWKVSAYGEGNDPSPLKAFAYCGSL
jgi:hypothetical protein